jgi:hypothetical protein
MMAANEWSWLAGMKAPEENYVTKNQEKIYAKSTRDKRLSGGVVNCADRLTAASLLQSACRLSECRECSNVACRGRSGFRFWTVRRRGLDCPGLSVSKRKITVTHGLDLPLMRLAKGGKVLSSPVLNCHPCLTSDRLRKFRFVI